MLSLTHLLLILVVLVLVMGPARLPNVAKGLGSSLRNFKKALRGEEDIDVTDSVKRLKDDHKEG